MTALARATSAAKIEVGKLRKRRIPEYPGSWKTHEGLGHENLDEVSAAVVRAVLLAARYETTDDPDYETATDRWRFNNRIDTILADLCFAAPMDCPPGPIREAMQNAWNKRASNALTLMGRKK